MFSLVGIKTIISDNWLNYCYVILSFVLIERKKIGEKKEKTKTIFIVLLKKKKKAVYWKEEGKQICKWKI